MHVNQRGFVWTDEGAEHDEADERRAETLARRWSAIHHEVEQEGFRREHDRESGLCHEWEPESCETCGGIGFVGLELPTNRRGHPIWPGCGDDGCPRQVVGIRCPNPDCHDGKDVGPIREAEERDLQRQADRDLEIELIEEKLERVGARMMRPYEHWNEDEALMEYLERDR